ncbi:uncharacterized protein TRAVEDRAFT_34500 [Trametes versicolor FP-101664 SS1]|uniref:uncharacterized protein n=1 Tax=Trametes versicolor (strain FP-101664) TaxID=717944 RepID=UPI000462186D|nr:uncharacterized protein TRAVEDRAFT_34500 [Trametes versicolor FP-101664 SS1]EIW63343.1 hypothetical protein TRAVEDRAFT_34500 [Trametes versicolor FP-101664 SS1]
MSQTPAQPPGPVVPGSQERHRPGTLKTAAGNHPPTTSNCIPIRRRLSITPTSISYP